MSDDRIFQAALIVGFVFVFPVAFYFRVRSQMTGEPLDRRQEGLFILLTLRPAGLLFMGTLIAYAIDPANLAWSVVPLPRSVRWTGIVLYACSGVLLLWTMKTLGPNLTDTVVTRRAHTLVTRGPYRWVRHPFYVSAMLLGIGATLGTASWFLPIVGIVFLSLLVLRTRIEEQKLVDRFGDAYRDYMDTTGRFWPRSANRTRT
jgi:protein-S-isoprenylcysteine O-methyltransferase Ste14